MKSSNLSRFSWIGLFLVIWGSAIVANRAGASPRYKTGFEAVEGYDMNFALDGQAGWLSEGSGGNGLVDGAFPGLGQQGYIGLFPPLSGDYLFLWQPLSFDPVTAGASVIKFSAEVSVMPSTTGEPDEFAWIAFNSQLMPLFVIDFENYNHEIYHRSDGAAAYTYSGLTYTNGVIYTLSVTMDFGANTWGASLDNRLIATNQPLTTTGLTLDLADLDIGWLIYDVNQPSDNYMIFDNYTFTLLPDLVFSNRAANGHVTLRAIGKEGWKLAVEASTNLTQWTALKTNSVVNGYFDYVDTGATALARRFYRLRIVP